MSWVGWEKFIWRRLAVVEIVLGGMMIYLDIQLCRSRELFIRGVFVLMPQNMSELKTNVTLPKRAYFLYNFHDNVRLGA